MELTYLIIFMCTISNVLCSQQHAECFIGLLLSGLTILVMFIIIICLSVALYMARNNRSLFGLNFNKQPAYFRQESGPGVTLCSVTSTNNISNLNKHGKDDGSTLTVNSGIVEIGSLTEPETPTRIEENRIPCPLVKKPIGPVLPTIQKAQMDKIIEGVLKKQKNDSTTVRDLDILAKSKTLKTYDSEFTVKRNSASLNQLDALANDELEESFYENKDAIAEMMSNLKSVEKNKPTPVTQSKATNLTKNRNLKQSVSFNSLNASIQYPPEEDEQEVYDTVPNPVRCTSDGDSDGYIEQLHVYDCPPRRQSPSRNVVMDQDSQYLLPLSKRVPEGEDKSYYANANTHK